MSHFDRSSTCLRAFALCVGTLAQAAGDESFSGSFNFPAIMLKTSASAGGITNPKDATFGIQTTRTADSLKFDHSYFDMVRPLPLGISSFVVRTDTAQTVASFAFSMDKN